MTSPLSLVKNSTVRLKKNTSSFSAFWFTLWLIRILILSVSLSVIAGGILTKLKPTDIPFFVSLNLNRKPTPVKTPISKVTPPQQTTQSAIPLKNSLLPLKQKILALATESSQIKPFGLFVDLDNGNYVDIERNKILSAASMIKIPVLVAFFQDVDAGKISLDAYLTMTKDDQATGSGNMQYEKPNTKFTALDTATRMMVISDNTATNMLIKKLGGKKALNSRFASWGLSSTSIQTPLPDLKGTNTTTSFDLASLLYKITQGELVSLKSRDRIIEIMQGTKVRTLLPQGLEPQADIAHKTGDIGTILGDAGIIDMPNGKRYIGVIFAQRPYNDLAGRELIQQISKTVYQGFKNPPKATFKKTNKP